MKLILTRKILTSKSTIGELKDEDGKLVCLTLEDCTREDGMKIPGETSIPYGTYEVIVSQSVRFKCLMPLLLDVPLFAGIRIHPGNTAEDTHGCILVGMTRHDDRIENSRIAFDGVFRMIQTAIAAGGKVFIEITDAWKGRDVMPEPYSSVKEV